MPPAERPEHETMTRLPSREDRHGPGSLCPFFRQPGYQALCLTRGFAPPPHGGFALSGRGLRRPCWAAKTAPGWRTYLPFLGERASDQPFTDSVATAALCLPQRAQCQHARTCHAHDTAWMYCKGDCPITGQEQKSQRATSPPIMASNSAVFARTNATFPRLSTFRRISGSVLDERRLKRQSAYSIDRPSV